MPIFKFDFRAEAFIEADSMEEAIDIADDLSEEIIDHCQAMDGYDITDAGESPLSRTGTLMVYSIKANSTLPSGVVSCMIRHETQEKYLTRTRQAEVTP